MALKSEGDPKGLEGGGDKDPLCVGVGTKTRDGARTGDPLSRSNVMTPNQWVHFLVTWYNQSGARHAEVMATTLAHHEEAQATLKSKYASLLSKYDILLSKLKETESKLDYLHSCEQSREQTKREAEERRKRRAARKRAPSRDAAQLQQYRLAIQVSESLGNNNFAKARDRVCLLFLFLTGMRVANLRELRVTHLRCLLSGQTLSIPQIKSKSTLTHPIPVEYLDLVEKRKEDIVQLIQGREDADFVITNSQDGRPLNRVNLTNRLNNLLKAIGKIEGRVLTSHSFRIGLTTILIERYGIEAARQIIGHKNISTTCIYSRHTLSPSRVKRMLGSRLRRKYSHEQKSNY